MSIGSNWGATDAECAMSMDCDELLPDPTLRMHRAVSIDAPAKVVFRRLCQLKLAPYSYDLLDNLGRRSPRELIAGVEQLEVGQRFMFIFTLMSFARDEQITLRSRRVAVTYTVIPSDEDARLLARVLFRAPGSGLVSGPLAGALALGDLLMMRKQLLTLKRLAEQDASGASAARRARRVRC